jgi:hypothetical protein
MPEPFQVAPEMVRVLKPRGRIAILTSCAREEPPIRHAIALGASLIAADVRAECVRRPVLVGRPGRDRTAHSARTAFVAPGKSACGRAPLKGARVAMPGNFAGNSSAPELRGRPWRHLVRSRPPQVRANDTSGHRKRGNVAAIASAPRAVAGYLHARVRGAGGELVLVMRRYVSRSRRNTTRSRHRPCCGTMSWRRSPWLTKRI